MSVKGSCHCGRIAFDVEGQPERVMECNCSYCTRRGSLLWFVPAESLRVQTPKRNLATYKFNKRVIEHLFCPTCGCEPFAYGKDPKGAEMAAINVRCLEGVELASLPRQPFDGRSL